MDFWLEENLTQYKNPSTSARLEAFVYDQLALRYDTMTMETQIWDKIQLKWRNFVDDDAVRLMIVAARHDLNVSSVRAHEMIKSIALEKQYDSLCEHLLAQGPWDGTKRLDTWLVDYIGAADTPYTRRLGRLWLISAMARAFRPGVECKVDNVLILRGTQGIGKSTMLKDLGGPFYSDANFDFEDDQKAGMKLRGVWIHEWGELDSMRKASHTRLKAFVSETVSRFRPPYGREVVTEPRRCVFAGSTNKDDFLTDTTGNRRFWPVHVKKYNRDLLEVRGQLLSEALVALNMGEPWWATQEDESLAGGYRSEVEEEDPWKEEIVGALKDLTQVSTHDILESTLAIPLDRLNQGHKRRVADVLRQLGWQQTNLRDSKGHRLWQR